MSPCLPNGSAFILLMAYGRARTSLLVVMWSMRPMSVAHTHTHAHKNKKASTNKHARTHTSTKGRTHTITNTCARTHTHLQTHKDTLTQKHTRTHKHKLVHKHARTHKHRNARATDKGIHLFFANVYESLSPRYVYSLLPGSAQLGCSITRRITGATAVSHAEEDQKETSLLASSPSPSIAPSVYL